MSTEYHKIQGLYKRHRGGDERGRFIVGEWARPELGYLAELDWEWTEKVDGTNIRIGLTVADEYPNTPLDYFLGGRTDRAQIPTPLIAAIHDLGLREKLPEHFEGPVMLYGEGYGGSIQKAGATYGNPQRFVLFDVKVGDYWLEREDVEDVAEKLGLDVVPIMGRGTLHEAIEYVKGAPYSMWGGAFAMEGVVCRPKVQLFNRFGERIICKVKVKDFRPRGGQ